MGLTADVDKLVRAIEHAIQNAIARRWPGARRANGAGG
jgi:hypothetical protein